MATEEVAEAEEEGARSKEGWLDKCVATRTGDAKDG